MKAYFATFDIFLEEHLPKLHDHFKQENFSPDMYLIDWYVRFLYLYSSLVVSTNLNVNM